MDHVLSLISHGESETVGLAEKIGLFLKAGDVVVLTGELGAGKTVFVRGVAKAMGIDENLVNSPSFTIVNEYPGRDRAMYHFDLYRVTGSEELVEIGWDDYLKQGGVVVIEWGEKAGPELPRMYYTVDMRIIDEQKREIEITMVKK